MIAELKRKLAQLSETNQVLTQDLDRSHRKTTGLARERDALRHELEQLRALARKACSRAEQAEQDRQLLLFELVQLGQERDQLRQELETSVSAMEEIHLELLDLSENIC